MNIQPMIQTMSGRYASLVDLKPHDVNIGDIAHSLSNICRFGGHTREFYSVAQHSCLVSTLVPQEFALEALLHDASEAYVGDMVLPLKRMLPSYRTVEGMVWRAIAQAYGLPPETSACVKEADLILLATERRDLMHEQSVHWPVLDGVTPMPESIRPREPAHARAEFLVRFWELVKEAA